MCRYEEWNRATHELGYCEAPVVSEGLCQEHLEWVADCKATEVSKLDMKYGYKLPRTKRVKLDPPKVSETIIEPGCYAKGYAEHEKAMGKQAMTYPVWFAQAIRPNAKAPEWTTPEQAKERDAKEFAEYAEQVAERKPDLGKGIVYVGTIPDTRPIGKRSAPEPNAETVCGFRFEYRAEGGSGFYWNGKRVASTREGLERMGTAILAKVCK